MLIPEISEKIGKDMDKQVLTFSGKNKRTFKEESKVLAYNS